MSDKRVMVGRRGFLVLGAGAILGGCVQDSTPGGRGTTQETTTQGKSLPPTANGGTKTAGTNRTETPNQPEPNPTTTAHDGVTIGGIDSDKNESQATAIVGGGIGSEQPEDWITVWNDADTARRITVSIAEKGASGEPLFQNTYQFKPDAYVEIGVSNPGEYVVSVGVSSREPTTIEFNVDDCNWQSLDVTVMPNGSVQSSKMSTLVACASVPITTENSS